MPFTAYIGIGSNQAFGDRSPEQLVAAAFGELGRAGRVSGRSSEYRAQPVGFADQPVFINAAAALQTELGPEELLDFLIGIERLYGRDRSAGIPKGPRTLDLDLLFMTADEGSGGDREIIHNSPSLALPHPEVQNRRFVLAPLAEIAPELRHPALKRTISELLAELPGEGANADTAVEKLNGADGNWAKRDQRES